MKNAIVTGGTSGIGLGVAKMLLNKGTKCLSHTLVLTLRSKLRTSKH